MVPGGTRPTLDESEIVGKNRDGHHRMVATSIQRCGAVHFFIGDV